MIVGIDPGASGGIAFIESSMGRKTLVKIFKFTTENDIIKLLQEHKPDIAVLEQVHSMPGQGVVSVFSFGANWGCYKGALLALNIPFYLVTPQKWQKKLGCMSKGNKNVTKNKAQQLYPSLKITHATADALLIATYGLSEYSFSIFD